MDKIEPVEINRFLTDDWDRCDSIISSKGDITETSSEKCIVEFKNQDFETCYLKLFSEKDSANVRRFYELAKPDWKIPEVLYKGNYGNRYYVIEREIEGMDLETILSENRITSPLEIVGTVKQICNQLSKFHSLNPAIIHGDIKPANIILDNNGKAFLIDFEFIEFDGTNTERNPRGTSGYLAPEIANRREIGPATDLYSLGIILKEWANKITYFNKSGIKSKNLLNDIITKACKDDLNDRYPTANDMIQQLMKLETFLILEAEIESLRTDTVKIYSESNAGYENLRQAKEELQLNEEILFLIECQNHHKIAFSETAIYSWQNAKDIKLPVKNLKLKINSKTRVGKIRYSEAICLKEIDNKSFFIILSKDNEQFWINKFQCQDVRPEKMKLILYMLIKSRENILDNQELEQYFETECRLAYSGLDKLDDKGKQFRWDIIQYMGEQSAGACNEILSDVQTKKSEYIKNNKK